MGQVKVVPSITNGIFKIFLLPLGVPSVAVTRIKAKILLVTPWYKRMQSMWKYRVR